MFYYIKTNREFPGEIKMNLILKGIHLKGKNTNYDDRGKTFLIGEVKAGIVLSDNGTFVTFTDTKFINYLKEYFKNES